jgi:Tfp pilus assembly protein PilO
MPPTKPAKSASKRRLGLPKLKLDPHYNYAVTVGVVGIVVSLLLALFAIRPLAISLVHATQDLNNKRIQSGALKEKIEDLKELQKSYKELGETNRQKILVALPPDSDSAHMLAVIETIGARSGVQVRTVTPLETAANPDGQPSAQAEVAPGPGGASSLPVSIGVRGSYVNILGFLKSLESGPRLMDITGVTFTGTGNPLEAQVSARAYYQSGAAS